MTLVLDMAGAPRAAQAAATAEGRLRVTVLADFAAAEPAWRSIEGTAVFSGYHGYDWQSSFHRHLGEGSTPCLAVICDPTGSVGAILPLGVERTALGGVASFIGGKHANFGMGLWQSDFAARMDGPALRAILADIARQSPAPIDLFHLVNQPEVWDGLANPFLALAHQPSPSAGYHLALGPDGEAVLGRVVSGNSRRKMRKKERNLAEVGPVSFKVAATRDEVIFLADQFLAFKAVRFQALGIANVFDTPGMRDFIIETAAEAIGTPAPALELCALMVGDEPVAVFGGAISRNRYSGTFHGITPGPLMGESPGELLLHHLIRHCCERGLAVFDLGAGEAQYKSNLCDGQDALFDQFVPVTPRGRLAAGGLSLAAKAKRHVKQSPRLWALVMKLRRMRGAASGAEH
jgi:CelD/BcsL family acetyltransferase involved in cellulose biosynthesis